MASWSVLLPNMQSFFTSAKFWACQPEGKGTTYRVLIGFFFLASGAHVFLAACSRITIQGPGSFRSTALKFFSICYDSFSLRRQWLNL